ncbi:MAG: hypothetical protein FWD60_03320 [Candidatus Azobacteroides sp.]|nr:hypothetical protein [Candidatus Azobacteroides sp.]
MKIIKISLLFAGLSLFFYTDLYCQSDLWRKSQQQYRGSYIEKAANDAASKAQKNDPYYQLYNSGRRTNNYTTKSIYTITISIAGQSYTLYYSENERSQWQSDYNRLKGANRGESVTPGNMPNPRYRGDNNANQGNGMSQFFDGMNSSSDYAVPERIFNTSPSARDNNHLSLLDSISKAMSEIDLDNLEAYLISNPSSNGIQIGDGIVRPREDYPSLPDSTYNKLPAPNDSDGGPNANFFLRGQYVDGYLNGAKMEQRDKELGEQLYDLLNNPKYEWQSIAQNFSPMQTYSLYSLLANENETDQIPALRHDLAQNEWLFMADNGNFYKISKDDNNLMVIEKTTYKDPEINLAILGAGCSIRPDLNRKTFDIDCQSMISGSYDFKDKKNAIDLVNASIIIPFNYVEKSKITISDGGDVQNNNVKLLSGANVGISVATDGVSVGPSYDLVSATWEKQQQFFDGNDTKQRTDNMGLGINLGINSIGAGVSDNLGKKTTANHLNTMPFSDDYKNEIFKAQVQGGISYFKNQALIDNNRINAKTVVPGLAYNPNYTPAAKEINQKVIILENIYSELNSGHKTYKNYLK